MGPEFSVGIKRTDYQILQSVCARHRYYISVTDSDEKGEAMFRSLNRKMTDFAIEHRWELSLPEGYHSQLSDRLHFTLMKINRATNAGTCRLVADAYSSKQAFDFSALVGKNRILPLWVTIPDVPADTNCMFISK